ncbi:MAG: mechanosensitive ion channel family protein [Candidatus Saccharibacteria bacterium]|nr:mechanosensitive ion channel family protein [Candidatus Saccharibacteria bacterium]
MNTMNQFLQIFIDNKFLKIIIVLILACVFSLIAKRVATIIMSFAMHRKISRHREQQKQFKTMASVISVIAMIIIWVVAFFVGLNILGVKIETLVTGAGIFGVIISLGAQNTIRDILAGFFIIAENQFRVGDVVRFYYAGQHISGTVEDVTLRVTKLRDIDGNLHTIRNGFSEVITNRTFKYANVNLDLMVAYDTDIDKLEIIINSVGQEIAEDDNFRDKIIKPISFLRIAEFGESGIKVKVLGKVEAAEQWPVASEFMRRIKKVFDQNKIEIPFNQIVIHQAKK